MRFLAHVPRLIQQAHPAGAHKVDSVTPRPIEGRASIASTGIWLAGGIEWLHLWVEPMASKRIQLPHVASGRGKLGVHG